MFSNAAPEPREGAAAPLAAARTRADLRAQRLVAAARELADERQSAAFTVVEVATRAGSSLKGFYRCFAGKDDLLVALLAEDSLVGADMLAARVAAESTHAGRLRTGSIGLFALCTRPDSEGYARVLASEHRRLSQERTDDLRAALAPIVAVIADAVRDAARAGFAQSSAPARDADTIFALVLDGIHAVFYGRADAADQAEYLWQFCGRALRVADA